MAMHACWFRFPSGLDEPAWRAALAAELGAKTAAKVEWQRSTGVPKTFGELIFPTHPEGVTTISSDDLVAIIYAHKVSRLLGGVAVQPNGIPIAKTQETAQGSAPRQGADDKAAMRWSDTPWIAMSWLQRRRVHAKIFLESMRAVATSRRTAQLPRARTR